MIIKYGLMQNKFVYKATKKTISNNVKKMIKYN